MGTAEPLSGGPPAAEPPSAVPSVERDTPVARWMGWRLRLLFASALVGCVGLFFLAHHLADQPALGARWGAGDDGRIVLLSSELHGLRPLAGQALVGIDGPGGGVELPDAVALKRSARWIVDDAVRARHVAVHEGLAGSRGDGTVGLRFADGSRVQVPLQRRGFGQLGAVFWLSSALALLLYLSAMVVTLARPTRRNLLYAVMSLAQAANLLFIAIGSVHELMLPAGFPAWDLHLRTALDLVTACAALHAASLYPRSSVVCHRIAVGAWVAMCLLLGLIALDAVAQGWWWTQLGVAVLCATAIGLLSRQPLGEPHPLALQLRRLGIVALAGWLLLTLLLALRPHLPVAMLDLVPLAPTVWTALMAGLLLLVPFLSRSQQIMREFALLAAVSTIATSLDLLFVTVFSLGQFASLTLSLFVSLAVYAGARQWVLNQLLGSGRLTTERMFEQLYRIAREAETHPQRVPALLLQLLRDQFEPMQAELVDGQPTSTQVKDDGSTLWVPLPAPGGSRHRPSGAVRLRFAQRGRRVFTLDDARLTDRILEQLRRAAAFDEAVEQGRREERLRLAQDLHDDIGARLLTLMYKAQSPEMEEYVRHTLKDLKTLTRGLAAPSHRLSHAAAEWKADLTQRLTAADVVLGWNFTYDRDVLLSVVQWSALTRILRELVSNAIAHAQARRVEIAFQLEGTHLDLSVTDNGIGGDPGTWSHGLGLGGVRKRVKQLGGEVEWRAAEPCGIRCRVRVRLQGLSD